MLGLLKALWRRWKALAHGIIHVQNWIVMAVAYLVGMGPVAVIMRMRGSDLLDRGPGDAEAESHWSSLPPFAEDIRRAQRPW